MPERRRGSALPSRKEDDDSPIDEKARDKAMTMVYLTVLIDMVNAIVPHSALSKSSAFSHYSDCTCQKKLK